MVKVPELSLPGSPPSGLPHILHAVGPSRVNGDLILSLPCDWLHRSFKTGPKSLPLSLLLSMLVMDYAPCSSSLFPLSPLGSHTAILICKTGLQAWAVQGPCLGASSQGSQEEPGLLLPLSAASSGWMDWCTVAGIWTSSVAHGGTVLGALGIGRSQLEFIPCPEENFRALAK